MRCALSANFAARPTFRESTRNFSKHVKSVRIHLIDPFSSYFYHYDGSGLMLLVYQFMAVERCVADQKFVTLVLLISRDYINNYLFI